MLEAILIAYFLIGITLAFGAWYFHGRKYNDKIWEVLAVSTIIMVMWPYPLYLHAKGKL